jgi:hypothetical protein
MISIGHQTGLYDTMATLAPSTSGQIATAAGLDERYVREWLGAMVTGRVVDHAMHDDFFSQRRRGAGNDVGRAQGS